MLKIGLLALDNFSPFIAIYIIAEQRLHHHNPFVDSEETNHIGGDKPRLPATRMSSPLRSPGGHRPPRGDSAI